MDHKITVTAAIVALIAGCSSGSDCEAFINCTPDAGNPGPGASGQALIDRDTALGILREAWFAAATTADVPSFVVATGIGDTSGGVASFPGNADKIAMRNRVYVAPFGPTTYNCPTSGTFTVSGDVADPNTVSGGDFSVYQASACDSGTGYTVDGTLRLDVGAVNGDPSSGQFEQDQAFTFTDFQAVAGSLSTTFSGDHSALIDSRPTDQVTVAFSGSSLRIDEQQLTVTVRSFSGLSTIETTPPFNNTLFSVGSASSTAVQGSFTYGTDEDMQIAFGQPPTDGIFQVFGEGGSTARVVVVTGTDGLVNVQVDENANTNFEFSTQVSWDDFLNGNLVLNWTETGLN